MVGTLPTTAHGTSTTSPSPTTRTDCTLPEVRLQKRRRAAAAAAAATNVTNTARKEEALRNTIIPQIMAVLDGVHHLSPHVLTNDNIIIITAADLLPTLASGMTTMTKQQIDTTNPPPRVQNQPLARQHHVPLVQSPPGLLHHISPPPPPPAHGPLEQNLPTQQQQQHLAVRHGPVPSAVSPTTPAKPSPPAARPPSSPKTSANSWTRTP